MRSKRKYYKYSGSPYTGRPVDTKPCLPIQSLVLCTSKGVPRTPKPRTPEPRTPDPRTPEHRTPEHRAPEPHIPDII